MKTQVFGVLPNLIMAQMLRVIIDEYVMVLNQCFPQNWFDLLSFIIKSMLWPTAIKKGVEFISHEKVFKLMPGSAVKFQNLNL